MKRIFLTVAFCLVSSFVMAEEKTILASADYSLSDTQVDELSGQAAAGSQKAAMRLSDRYFYDSSPDNAFKERALYWALIGAENGSSDAQFRAYQLLRSNVEKNDQVRAFFWLKAAAKKQHQLSRWVLKECPELNTVRPSGAPCFGPESKGH